MKSEDEEQNYLKNKINEKGNGCLTQDEFFRGYKQFYCHMKDKEDSASLSPINDDEDTTSFDALMEESGLGSYIQSEDKSLRDSWKILKKNQETLMNFEFFLKKIASEVKNKMIEKDSVENGLKLRLESQDERLKELVDAIEEQNDGTRLQKLYLSNETELESIISSIDSLENQLIDMESICPDDYSEGACLERKEAQIKEKLEMEHKKMKAIERSNSDIGSFSQGKSELKYNNKISQNAQNDDYNYSSYPSDNNNQKHCQNTSRKSTHRLSSEEPFGSFYDTDGFEEVDIRRKSQDQDPSSKEIVFVGDSTVGKTSLINRFCTGCFYPNTISTVGVDYRTRNVLVDNKDNVCIQVWDTAGQERYRSITRQYFRKTDAVVIVYDISEEKSFINVRSWLHDAREGAGKESIIVLLGNKVDLEIHSRKVQTLEGLQLSCQFDTLFHEVSALNGIHVEHALTQMVKLLLQKEDREIQKAMKLGLKKEFRKQRCCR
ncbi:RASEF [Lepeophtheirus salmonis]|uniref:RASEF n=1 Tax=Lepeophtheirus salmonis TaxID=72036 RepID=A0A7R8CQ52_LEPSM|nr:RASEF [Lepeophtheirus salmonis]CAF2891889.1 RASEF [Lepeophtheirus salmonis]